MGTCWEWVSADSLKEAKMKKSSLVLLSLVLAGAASAEDLLKPEEHPVVGCGISFATPIQAPAQNATIDGFRWNIIYGENFGTHGCDIGFVGANRADASGFQLDIVAGWDDFDFTGCQIAGVGNAVLGGATGFQLAGAVNYTRGAFTGFQLAPVNYAGSLYGMQVAALNVNKVVSKGFQIGAYNADLNEYSGWSFGAVNYADRIEGLQLGALNIIATAGRGVQIGVINSAVVFSGIQIGVLNLIGNAEIPILPIMNAQF